ncbi:MAG: bifunctional glutamate N-acetyltransferase/amino-acid acetyltransferase ArgJ [Gammaproteobacteria bacterium]|nr:bifunctional glutamate N-acetyltransferase/amino-acid acetyltransferase ArgJ [Gammaproteobacteria bacterium]
MNTIAKLLPVAGVQAGTACARIKQTEQDDLSLFSLNPGSVCAAVFTRNAFCAAPVEIAREHLSRQAPRFLLINSGNANAGTGVRGKADALAYCQTLAEAAGCATEAVLPFSTGVIGQRLPVDKIRAALPDALRALRPDGWDSAARAIMTTDTVPKGVSVTGTIQEKPFTVTGIAKGAGMIRPDMAAVRQTTAKQATLLAFIATDAKVSKPILQACLDSAANASFNRITVDGDTSTNDACVLIASGRTATIAEAHGPAFAVLQQAVTEVCTQLAQALVRDAEGASKFITIAVEEGHSEQECLQVAYTIAHSPLVKTAFFASDANWGRILAAIGRADIADLDIQPIRIYLGDVCIVRNGGCAEEYTEEQGQAVMAAQEITVRVLLGRGEHLARIWTCDLSYDYVRINAEYRT